jgi:hypothetical protein
MNGEIAWLLHFVHNFGSHVLFRQLLISIFSTLFVVTLLGLTYFGYWFVGVRRIKDKEQGKAKRELELEQRYQKERKEKLDKQKSTAVRLETDLGFATCANSAVKIQGGQSSGDTNFMIVWFDDSPLFVITFDVLGKNGGRNDVSCSSDGKHLYCSLKNSEQLLEQILLKIKSCSGSIRLVKKSASFLIASGNAAAKK